MHKVELKIKEKIEGKTGVKGGGGCWSKIVTLSFPKLFEFSHKPSKD